MAMKARTVKIDWLLLERKIRDTLEKYGKDEVTSFRALRLIDENLAALTLRGSVLPEDNIPFGSFRGLKEEKADRVVGVEQDEIWCGTEISREEGLG